jgi:predicted transcriptional regulator
MLVRGLSADEVAAAAEVARATLYNALSGRPTRLRTARRVLEVLAGVEPTLRLSSLTEDC